MMIAHHAGARETISEIEINGLLVRSHSIFLILKTKEHHVLAGQFVAVVETVECVELVLQHGFDNGQLTTVRETVIVHEPISKAYFV